MKNIYDVFLETIKEHNMLDGVKKIYVALSGGADSIALLHLFLRLSQTCPIIVEAIHIHHGIRVASDSEMEEVERICTEKGIQCNTVKVSVLDRVKKGVGLELAARECRYEVFESLLKDESVRIALGHHLDDQAETVLMNLFRGSGLKGLGGILNVRGQYIRPLLGIRKADIIAYCNREALSYVIDESNQDIAYRRNLLRNEVIPYLEGKLGGNISNQLYRSSQLLQEDENCLDELADQLFAELAVTTPKGIVLPVEALKRNHLGMKRRLIRKAIEKVNKGLFDIGFDHIGAIIELLDNQTGKGVDLPNDIRVYRDYEVLVITLNQTLKTEGIGRVRTKILREFERLDFPKNIYTKWFDYDKIKGTVVLRNRRDGDYIRIGETLGKKKLKDYFIDSKVSRELRNQIPLLTDDESVLWIIGYRMNDSYKVSDNTKTVLEVEYIDIKEDSLNGWRNSSVNFRREIDEKDKRNR